MEEEHVKHEVEHELKEDFLNKCVAFGPIGASAIAVIASFITMYTSFAVRIAVIERRVDINTGRLDKIEQVLDQIGDSTTETRSDIRFIREQLERHIYGQPTNKPENRSSSEHGD